MLSSAAKFAVVTRRLRACFEPANSDRQLKPRVNNWCDIRELLAPFGRSCDALLRL